MHARSTPPPTGRPPCSAPSAGTCEARPTWSSTRSRPTCIRRPDAHSYFTADPISSLIIVQGGWWYRAEYRVVAGETGSLIEHTLLNVAERMHWAGPIAGRREIAAAPAVFQALVKALREELE